MPPYSRPRSAHLEPLRATVRPAPVQPPRPPLAACGHAWSHYLCAEVRSDTVNGRWGYAWGLASILANALVGVVLAIWASVEVRDNGLIVIVTGDLSLA